jgi:hypothetical protein
MKRVPQSVLRAGIESGQHCRCMKCVCFLHIAQAPCLRVSNMLMSVTTAVQNRLDLVRALFLLCCSHR